MFSRTIRIDAETDIKTVAASLRESAEGRVMSATAMMELVEPMLSSLFENGRNIAGTGGQFRGAKKIEGKDFCITLKAEFGPPKRGFLASLFGKG